AVEADIQVAAVTIGQIIQPSEDVHAVVLVTVLECAAGQFAGDDRGYAAVHILPLTTGGAESFLERRIDVVELAWAGGRHLTADTLVCLDDRTALVDADAPMQCV